MKKGSLVTIGIGKEVKTLILCDNYYLEQLIDSLPIGTSITVTSMDIIRSSDDIDDLFNPQEKKES